MSILLKAAQCQPFVHLGRLYRKTQIGFSPRFDVRDLSVEDETVVGLSGTLGVNTGTMMPLNTTTQELQLSVPADYSPLKAGYFSVPVDLTVDVTDASGSFGLRRYKGFVVIDPGGVIVSASMVAQTSLQHTSAVAIITSSINSIEVYVSGTAGSRVRTNLKIDSLKRPEAEEYVATVNVWGSGSWGDFTYNGE